MDITEMFKLKAFFNLWCLEHCAAQCCLNFLFEWIKWTKNQTNVEMCDTFWRSCFYLNDYVSCYVSLTRSDSSNIAPAYKKWISLNWNQSLWTLMSDVILQGKIIQEFPNLCHSIHFQSNAISKAKHIHAFILLIRRKNNFYFFISEAV